MNFREARQRIEEQQSYIATFDELVHHLQKAIDGKLEVPVDTEEETVGAEVLAEVQTSLKEMRAEHAERIAELERMEVVDVTTTK